MYRKFVPVANRRGAGEPRPGRALGSFQRGGRPAGYVHPLAVQVLAEIGVAHQGRSKEVGELRGEVFDLVVTVCDEAAEECPVWLGKGRVVHLGFPDPAEAAGTPEEVLEVFRSLRDDMRLKIEGLLA